MSIKYVSSTTTGQDTAPITKDHGIQGIDMSPRVVEKMKNVNHLFSQGTRRACTNCATKQVSWSCIGCDRHLPNGKWADLGLPAEDEDESLFGRLRQVVQSGLVKDEDQHTFAYEQVQYVLKSWIIQDESTPIAPPVIEECGLSLDRPGWKWANTKLSAEDSSASIMGVLRSMSGLGLIGSSISSGWIQFGRSLANCWALLEPVLNGSIAQTPLPAALANELKKYRESTALKPMPRALADGLCKYSNLSMASFEAQTPAFSEFGMMLIDRGYSLHQVSVASPMKKETPRLTVGPPPKRYLKEVAKVVETNNKILDEERARKDRAKERADTDRQVKKDEAAARKSRAQEDQRKARQRKAERRKQGKLQRTEKQVKIPESWRSSQSPLVNPVADSKPHEDDIQTTEPELTEETLANAVSPWLENGVEGMILEIAPASTTDEDGVLATSSSDSNTLVDRSASSSFTKICSIHTAVDCQCDECVSYDLAIDTLEGGSPDETPSHRENIVELLLSQPRSSRSESVVCRLEDIASSLQISERHIPKDKAPENAFASQHNSSEGLLVDKSHIPKDNAPETAFASQHNSIGELIEGTRPKSILNVSAPPFAPKVVPGPSHAQQYAYRLHSASELPKWVELGLAAEAADDSLFSRVWQLEALGALTLKDKKDFGTIISKFWKQMYLATQDSPNALKAMSLPHGSGSCNWSDLQLSAEDREDSILGVSQKLASLGFWSVHDENTLQNITLRVAKMWSLARSEADAPSVVVAGSKFPKADPEPKGSKLQNGASTALSQQSFGCHTIGPLPCLYRDGRVVSSETDLSDCASSDAAIAEKGSDGEMDAETDEVIVFKPRGRR